MAKKDKNKTKVQGQLPLENSTVEAPKNGAAERAEKARKASIEQQAKAQAEKEAKQKEEEERLKKAQEDREAKKKAAEEAKQQAQADYETALDSARDTAQGTLAERALGKAGLGGIFEETPEQEKKREAGIQARQEAQKEDVESLKEEGEDIVEEQREASESDAKKNLESLESLVRERIEGTKNDPIYNELPRTIRQAYKAGEFGDPVNEDIRKAYRAEMKKPKTERKKEVIEDYKKELERTKDARNAKNWYTMNAIGTGLMNFGSALKGGGPIAETEWNKRQGARIANAQQRYKDLLDAKANTVIDELKNKQGFDQKTQAAIRSLYNDRRLQPILNRLDTDSQIQLIDLMQEKKDAINFNAFVNALVLSLVKNPEGAVSTALGVGKDVVDLVK